MWELYVLALVLLGLIVVGLIIPEESPILQWLIRHRLYFLYHVVLTVYLLPLGSFGKKLHTKSFFTVYNLYADLLDRAVEEHKSRLFSDFRKVGSEKLQLLEIGIGPGRNFAFYPYTCDLIALEPAGLCKEMIQKKLTNYDGVDLKEFIEAGAEDMSMIPDESVDAVIGTWTLCSVSNPEAVLNEVFRVLKPGGKYYFCEHIFAQPKSLLCIIQKILNLVWPFWMCGCSFRNSPAMIQRADFSGVTGKYVTLDHPEIPFELVFVTPTYFGIATK